MRDGKTCVEVGYKDITSLSQCKSAFRLVPEHPGKSSWSLYDVSWRHCSSFVVPAFVDGCFSPVLLLVLLNDALFPFP